MRARRSTDASATRLSTPKGVASSSNRIPRVSRIAGGPLMRVLRRIFPFIQRVFADSGYLGEKVAKPTLIAVGSCARTPIRSGLRSIRGVGS
jgi:hypothetical protein